jgi:serine/threonine-protein kinase
VCLVLSEGAAGFQKLKVVKYLRAELAARPEFLEAFLAEARLAARLNHPNVVQTNEVGFDEENYFIEMEYLEGQSLETITRFAAAEPARELESARWPMPVPLALFIVSEMLAGLHYAHELSGLGGERLGIVHRDISPHNIFVTYDGVVKLLDFGIAKAEGLTNDSSHGGVKGKIAYMAPEQAAGKPVDPRSDVFASGVVLWQLLAGRRLWEGLDPAAIARRLAFGEIPALERVAPSLPGALSAICMRAMAPSPEARFHTAAEFQKALDAHASAGRRQLSDYMLTLLAQRRAEDRAALEARLAQRAGAAPTPSLPRDPAATLTGELTATTTPPTAATPLALPHGEPRRPSRLLRDRIARFASAALALGLFAAYGMRAWVGRGRLSAPTSSGALPSAPRSCKTNADCWVDGSVAPSVCRADGACVPLETDRCRIVADERTVRDDRTLWIGAMFPLSGPDAETFGRESVNAADLARQDFMRISKGVPPQHAEGPPRPIGLIACDDAAEPLASAWHLAHDVRTPAVVGFYSSQEVIDLATQVFFPQGVLVIATQNRSALVTTIPHPPSLPRLVFRTTTSMTAAARPVAAVIERILEPELRAAPGLLRRREPLRVALVRARNVSGLSVANAFLSELHFNGKTAAENGSAYREFVFDDGTEDYSSIASEIVAFAPHVVVLPGVDGAAKTLLEPIDTRWTGPKGLPRYVVGNYIFGDDFFAFLGQSAERRRRFLGVNPPSLTTANRMLTVHYNESYAPPVTVAASPGAVYDAMYLLLYAAFAAGDNEAPGGATTGVSLVDAFPRLLPPGAPVDVGPANLFDAFAILGRGGTIDLQGAATRLDFDLTTGETTSDFAVLCVGTEVSESNVVYRAKTATLEHLPLRCP